MTEFGNHITPLLSNLSIPVDYALEFRTGLSESCDWVAFPFEDFTLTRDAGSADSLPVATLRVAMPLNKASLGFEADPACHVQLLACIRLTCSVGAESEVLFSGRVSQLDPEDYKLTVLAQDWLGLAAECDCEIMLSPEETAELPARQVQLVGGGSFGSAYGFTYEGAGDPAFNGPPDPGKRRRAWAPGDIRLFYDPSLTQEVSARHYQVNLQGGTVSLLEDTTGRMYFASGVRCMIEGTLDWSEVIRAALQYPQAMGGMGAQPAEMDCPSLGIDVAGPLYYRGRVLDLLRQVLERQQANLRLWYDSASGKFTLRLIEQLPAGQEDYALLHPQAVSEPRDLRDIFSRVVVSGLCERPRNALALLPAGAVTSIVSQGDWFAWDGVNAGPDQAFSAVGSLLYDGNEVLGASVHNLAASEGGGVGKYDSWYGFFQVDLGAVQRVSRVRIVLPGSRNLNASAGHQGLFWPGIRILASEDGSSWRLLSAALSGRFPPRERLQASGAELIAPRARYLKVLCGAYKHGFENQTDPSIGLGEIEVFATDEYRIVKEIDPQSFPATYYSYTADYDNDGVVDTWKRNYPSLASRLLGRHRTRYIDLADTLNEYLAHDYALDLLAESVRLFRQARYTAIFDPRIHLFDTVKLDDSPGGAGSILVERVVISTGGTEICGTDYLALTL